MTKLLKQHTNKLWKKILIFLGIFFAVVVLSVIYLLANIRTNNNAKIALGIIEPFSKVTLSKNANIEFLKHSLILIKNIPMYSEEITSFSNQSSNDNYLFDIKSLTTLAKEINFHLQNINQLSSESFLAQKIIPDDYLTKLDLITHNLPDFIKVANSFATKDQKVIIVFQNSDEIRATGGFMGSYAILDIVNGKIIDITVEDIYDADGQFEGFIEAPKGVKEYLSDNKGFRLSNSNWHPDFTKSAEQTLQFFALGNKKNVTTLVAVNQDYAKVLLNIIGEITLKDYNTIVSSNNISEVLRSRRDTFFPGSKQKKHLLSQLLTQLQIKIASADEKSKLAIITQTLDQLALNNIQIYSANEEIDAVFSKYNLRQELELKDNSEYLFLVESNVGINKANKNIDREVVVEMSDFENLITVNFKNNNLPPTISSLTNLVSDTENEEENKNQNSATNHLGYVDYQRIIVKPSWQLSSINYKGQPISEWDEDIIESKDGTKFKQIGLLITLREKESASLEMKFENSEKNQNKIYIQKQPGIPNTQYTIKKGEVISKVLLEKDFWVE